MLKSIEDVSTDFQFAGIDSIVHHTDEEIVRTQSLSNLDPATSYVKIIETTNDALGNVYEVRISGIARNSLVGQIKIKVIGDCFRHRSLFGEL